MIVNLQIEGSAVQNCMTEIDVFNKGVRRTSKFNNDNIMGVKDFNSQYSCKDSELLEKSPAAHTTLYDENVSSSSSCNIHCHPSLISLIKCNCVFFYGRKFGYLCKILRFVTLFSIVVWSEWLVKAFVILFLGN